MTESSDLFRMIDQLVDRWCERRALGPLRHILPVYPLINALSDGWFELYRGLKNVKVFCKKELLPEEEEILRAAMNLLAGAFDRQKGKGSWYV